MKRERSSKHTASGAEKQTRTIVVDKSIGGTKDREKTKDAGIFDTIKEAVDSCRGPSIIKITSYNYDTSGVE